MTDYNITLADGNIVTVTDGAILGTYAIPLIGQNATTYGDDVAKAFLNLLENFASGTAPENNVNLIGSVPHTILPGQIWFDKTNNRLNVNTSASETTTPTWSPIASTASGTVTNSTLRWGGSGWVEETQVQVTSAGALSVRNSGLTDNISISHNGTNALITTTNTNNIEIGETGTRLRLPSTSDVNLSSTNHPFQIGGDNAANIRMDNNEIIAANNGSQSILNLQTNGGDVIIGNAGGTGSLYIRERASAGSDIAGLGQVWINTSDSGIYFTNDSGVDTRLDVSVGGTVTASNGADNRIAVFSTATNVEGDASLQWDASTATLSLFNTGDTDSLTMRHNGVDFSFSATNTADINFTGMDRFIVQDGATADFIIDTGSGVDVRNGLFLRIRDASDSNFVTLSHDGTDLNIAGSSTTDIDISSVNLKLLDNVLLKFGDDDDATITYDGNSLDFNSAVPGEQINFLDGPNIRIWNSGNADRGEINHDGTNFNISGVNTTAINIIPTGSELAVEAIANGNTNLYANNILSVGAWTVASGRSSKAFVVESDSATQRNVGYNESPTRSTGSGTFTIGREDVSYFLTHDGVMSSTTISLPNDSTIPVGATFLISNDGSTSGTLTIQGAGGVTLRWLDGSGSSSAPTGTRTLAKQGICTVRKKNNSEYFIWGNGLS